MLRLCLVAGLLAATLPAVAGKYNPTLSIGDAAPRWEALPSVEGETYGPADARQAKVVVLAFTCNTCPYAVDHEDRLNALAKSWDDKPVQLIVFNCNRGRPDGLDAMKQRAKEKSFAFPYLKDGSGAVGKAFGALRTPEFVVLNEDRQVVYLGALDDDPDGKAVKRRYVEDAVSAVLAGKRPSIEETSPVGCLVKYPRDRRR